MKKIYRPPHFRPVGKKPRSPIGKIIFDPYRVDWVKFWIFDYKAKRQKLSKSYCITRCDSASAEWFYTEDELQNQLKWYENDDRDGWYNNVGLLIQRYDGYGKNRWTMDVMDYVSDKSYMVLGKNA